jgi:hypothetical protein
MLSMLVEQRARFQCQLEMPGSSVPANFCHCPPVQMPCRRANFVVDCNPDWAICVQGTRATAMLVRHCRHAAGKFQAELHSRATIDLPLSSITNALNVVLRTTLLTASPCWVWLTHTIKQDLQWFELVN